MQGQVFLGRTSTKLGLMCLAQGPNAGTPVRLEKCECVLVGLSIPAYLCHHYQNLMNWLKLALLIKVTYGNCIITTAIKGI